MTHTKLPTDKYWCKKCQSRCVDVYENEGMNMICCMDCGHEEEFQPTFL